MKPILPASQTDFNSSLLGYLFAMAMIFVLHERYQSINPLYALLLVVTACIIPPLIADIGIFKRWREHSAGLRASRTVSLGALWRKCFGFAVTLAGFVALYAMFPEYKNDFYRFGFDLLRPALPVLLALAPFYFFWCLKRLDDPWDGYDEMAELARLRIKDRDWREIGRHWRNWLVKGFFLPLMFVFLGGSISELIRFDPVGLTNFLSWQRFLFTIIMMGDLIYAAVGYAFTLRPLNAHIRSSEPTMLGWVVAVICYQPFWQGFLYTRYLAYDGIVQWDDWLAAPSVLQIVWGSTILALMTVYSLATICLGIRFSNLTYRGLITSGPYRFTKHPAYVAKNLSWWLMSVPFIAANWHVALSQCVLLFGVNIIYYLRALTEERHLSNYPEYVEYALAMNERSIFRGLTKYLPFLKYKKPKHPPAI